MQNRNMITAAIKDKVLFFLCSNAIPEKMSEGETRNTLKELEIDFDTFNAIMTQFQRFDFIEDLNLRRMHMSFILRTEAHDFAEKGGFSIQDEIFRANIEKLGFEIDNLRKQLGPDKLDALSKLSSIFSAITGGLALWPK